MSRQNKKSRMKFLPPKIQLDERMATTGSYPTVSRLSVDGRTGNYPVSFDDTKTIVFGKKESIKDYIQYYLRAEEELYTTPDYYFAPSYAKGYSRSLENQLLAIHNGTVGAIPAQTSFEGNGRTLNYAASNTYTKIEDTTGLNLFNTFAGGNDRPFSISVRVRTNSTEALFKTVARVVDETTAYSQWTLAYNPSVQMILFTLQGVGSISCLSFGGFSPFFSVGSEFWIHATYDGSRTPQGINIYVTELFTGTTISLLNNNKTGAVNMGANPANSGFLLIGKGSTAAGTSWNGEISQFCLFNKVLSKDDFQNLVNQGFKSYVAQGSPLAGIDFGVGLDTASSYLGNTSALRENESSKDFTGTGNIIKGIGDATPMVHFTQGQEGGPFRDNDQYAVDGKSDEDPFFAIGTTIADGGEGFTSPLWSKNKIEIDIGCSSTSNISMFMQRTNTPIVDSSYNMCYYDFSNKKWEGIGVGRWLDSGDTNFVNTYNTVGFLGGLFDVPDGVSLPSFSYVDKLFEYQKNAARISDLYGFPFDARYHATSSQLFPMSTVINKPFLVEKIVINLSASFKFDENIQNGVAPPSSQYELTSSFFPGAINNIFLLNQRKNAKINYFNESYANSIRGVLTSSLPRTLKLSNISSSDTRVDTIRDIVTYGGVSSFASNVKTFVTRSSDAILGTIPYRTENPKELFSRDIVIDTGIPLSKSLSALNWDQNLEFKLKPKCPSYLSSSLLDGESRKTFGGTSGGSNNLGVLYPSGRNQSNFIKKVESTEELPLTRFVTGDFDSNTPYILYPEDNLILGWQQPSPSVLDDWSDITTGIGFGGSTRGTGRLCQISFASGPAKLVLYGSYVTEGKENNDSLNQLLSSDSVHEVIGED